MATPIFKKDSAGFSITKNGVLESFSGEPVRVRLVNNVITILISGQPYMEVQATDTPTVNDVPYSGTMAALAQKLKNEVFFLTNNSAGSLTLPAGTSSYTLTAGTLVKKVIVTEPTTIQFRLGTANGGAQLGTVATSNGYGSLTIGTFFPASTTLYFGGLTANSLVKIIKE